MKLFFKRFTIKNSKCKFSLTSSPVTKLSHACTHAHARSRTHATHTYTFAHARTQMHTPIFTGVCARPFKTHTRTHAHTHTSSHTTCSAHMKASFRVSASQRWVEHIDRLNHFHNCDFRCMYKHMHLDMHIVHIHALIQHRIWSISHVCRSIPTFPFIYAQTHSHMRLMYILYTSQPWIWSIRHLCRACPLIPCAFNLTTCPTHPKPLKSRLFRAWRFVFRVSLSFLFLSVCRNLRYLKPTTY